MKVINLRFTPYKDIPKDFCVTITNGVYMYRLNNKWHNPFGIFGYRGITETSFWLEGKKISGEFVLTPDRVKYHEELLQEFKKECGMT